jgi:hypothetical protein
MPWIKGKRRNIVLPEKQLKRLISRLEDYLIQTNTSWRELARTLGRSERTVRRWRDGEDWPSEQDLEAIVKVIEEQG